MKYLSCRIGNRRLASVQQGGRSFDLSVIVREELGRDLPPHRSSDLGALLSEGVLNEKALGAIRKGFAEDRFSAYEVDTDSMKILPPVPAPSKIIAVGRNYPAHTRERGKPPPKEPILFAKLPSALIGHGEPIRLPHWVHTRIDHEVELAVVIGRVAKDLKPEEALDAAFGYTVFNDVTARELQGSSTAECDPSLKSKSFDTFAPMGPAVVPAGDPSRVISHSSPATSWPRAPRRGSAPSARGTR
jgi:2-keto-4-pentenoate hydratase/2-oxohepta-3-ene-1,7-dioic acid hydratase in catechol pathway